MINNGEGVTFVCNTQEEARWVYDRLKNLHKWNWCFNWDGAQENYPDMIFKYIHSRKDNQLTFDTKENSWKRYTQYNVSALMQPLKNGPYQIETEDYAKWLLLKLLLQDKIKLTDYDFYMGIVDEIGQFNIGSCAYNGTFGWESKQEVSGDTGYCKNGIIPEPSDFNAPIVEIKAKTEISELPLSKVPKPLETNEGKTTIEQLPTYLLNIDGKYVKVMQVSGHESNADMLRVVDLVGEKFMWVYKRDLYVNNLTKAF